MFNNAGSRPSNPISFLLPYAILNARKWCARGLVIFVPVLARLLFPGGMFCAPFPGPQCFVALMMEEKGVLSFIDYTHFDTLRVTNSMPTPLRPISSLPGHPSVAKLERITTL